MNENVINERISSYFEAKPPKVSVDHCKSIFWSETGAWIHNCLQTELENWQPLDYFTSEDANARLLEAMRDHNPVLRFVEAPINAWVLYLWTAGQPVPDGIPMTNVSLADCSRSPDRKTAIALAFCKFAGIEVTTS